VCKLLLEQFGVEVGSHVVELGGVTARYLSLSLLPECGFGRQPRALLDPEAEEEMIAASTRPRRRATRWAAWSR